MKTTMILKAAALACAAVLIPVSSVSASAENAPEIRKMSRDGVTVTCTEDENGKTYEVSVDDIPEDALPFCVSLDGVEINCEDLAEDEEVNAGENSCTATYNEEDDTFSYSINGDDSDLETLNGTAFIFDGAQIFGEENGLVSGTITFNDEDGTLCVSLIDFDGDQEVPDSDEFIFDGAQVFTDEDGEWEDIQLTEEDRQAIDALEQQLDSIFASLPDVEEGNEEAYKAAYAEHEADITAIHEKINDIYMKAAGFDLEDPDALCTYCISICQDEDGNVEAKACKSYVSSSAEVSEVLETDDLGEELSAVDETI